MNSDTQQLFSFIFHKINALKLFDSNKQIFKLCDVMNHM